MRTDETMPTGGAGHRHAPPQHNAFAHELLAADPAVPGVGPDESNAQGTSPDVDDEERFDAG